MNPKPFNFLAAVLGDDGANALEKAGQRSEELNGVLVPRTILAWLQTTAPFGFDGVVPGVPGTYMTFAKSEGAAGFDGAVDVGTDRYEFRGASLFHLAASVATVLGVEAPTNIQAARDTDIERVGKSIDLLVKSHLINDMAPCECGKKDCKECLAQLEKAGMGMAAPAKPHAPAAPAAPAPALGAAKAALPKLPKAPNMQQLPKIKPQQPYTPKATTVNLTKSEAAVKCAVCGVAQFKGNSFEGCMCLRGLAKAATVSSFDNWFCLKLSDEWDREAVATLLEAVGRH